MNAPVQTKGNIWIFSTSFHEIDRRMQRISGSLAKAGYGIHWMSRSLEKNKAPAGHFTHKTIAPIFNTGPLFYLEFNLRIFLLLLSGDYDIIYSVDLDTLGGASLASFFRRKKVIFDAHEIFYEVPELNGKPIKKKIWESLAMLCIPNLNHCITVNKSVSRHYEERYSVPFHVIRNIPESYGLDDNVQRPTNERKLIYIGALNKGRGIELAIGAMASFPDYELLIVGEGDLSSDLREQAQNSIAAKRITFAGYIKPDSLTSLLAKASTGLNMLSPDNDNYRLSLGNKFFDYMHALVPSIHMDFPEYRQIVEENEVALLAAEYSQRELIRLLKELENPDIYSRIVSHCRQAKKIYNWQAEEKKLNAFMKNISIT